MCPVEFGVLQVRKLHESFSHTVNNVEKARSPSRARGQAGRGRREPLPGQDLYRFRSRPAASMLERKLDGPLQASAPGRSSVARWAPRRLYLCAGGPTAIIVVDAGRTMLECTFYAFVSAQIVDGCTQISVDCTIMHAINAFALRLTSDVLMGSLSAPINDLS